MKRKVSSWLMAFAVFALCLTGCGSRTEEAEPASAEENKETQEEQSEADKEDEMTSETAEKSKDTAILVVSFGTSYNESRDITIGAIEEAIAEAFPKYEVRRAFTSQIIIDKLKERDGLEIDNVQEALDRAVADGIRTLIVQPTHLMDGYEYTDLAEELEEYESSFDQIVLGAPLLTSDEDFNQVIAAITDATADYVDDETAIVFMGHGTEADSNEVYEKLQEKLTAAGFSDYYIGTVEASPSLEDIRASLKEAGCYKKVVLEPLMVVAGDHANNDMAGEEEDSWKSVLTADGYEVECLIHGLGENEAIRDIYVSHVQAAMGNMTK